MGHSIQYYTVEVSKGKKGQSYIEAIANEDAIRQGDYAEPLHNEIRWIDETYEDYEDAERAIERLDNGWYDQLAVKYKEYEGAKKTKTIESLEERIERYERDLIEYKEKNSVVNRKSQFVGCNKCESKINKKYVESRIRLWTWNTCPLCKNQLSSNSVLHAIETKEERIRETREKLHELVKINNQKGKHKLMWLLKTEFHV